jgi:hypothetical protein
MKAYVRQIMRNCKRRHDIQQYDIQQSDTKHDFIQHYGLIVTLSMKAIQDNDINQNSPQCSDIQQNGLN